MEQGESEKESCFSRSVRTYERDGLSLIQGEIIDIENLPGRSLRAADFWRPAMVSKRRQQPFGLHAMSMLTYTILRRLGQSNKSLKYSVKFGFRRQNADPCILNSALMKFPVLFHYARGRDSQAGPSGPRSPGLTRIPCGMSFAPTPV